SLCVFNDTATTYIYTLSLHDALPILVFVAGFAIRRVSTVDGQAFSWFLSARSEEHTSELQSLAYLVCRFLLGKKEPLAWKTLPPHYAPTGHGLGCGCTRT